MEGEPLTKILWVLKNLHLRSKLLRPDIIAFYGPLDHEIILGNHPEYFPIEDVDYNVMAEKDFERQHLRNLDPVGNVFGMGKIKHQDASTTYFSVVGVMSEHPYMEGRKDVTYLLLRSRIPPTSGVYTNLIGASFTHFSNNFFRSSFKLEASPRTEGYAQLWFRESPRRERVIAGNPGLNRFVGGLLGKDFYSLKVHVNPSDQTALTTIETPIQRGVDYGRILEPGRVRSLYSNVRRLHEGAVLSKGNVNKFIRYFSISLGRRRWRAPRKNK